MRALVTGASGFLGQHLVDYLFDRDDFVVGLVRDYNRTARKSSANAIVFGSFDQVERVIAEYEIDTVFHLAAQTQVSVSFADPVGTLEANVQGTWQVLEACRRQKVGRVIVASSDKSYGDGPTPYREDQPLRPNGIYATSKACADMLAQSYAREYGMSVAITRCGNLFGPGHTNWSTLIPGTIRSILKGERPRLRSNGGPKRDWLYVGDAVDGYLRLADATVTGAFNFGTGVGTSVIEVVDTVLKVMGSRLQPVFEEGQRTYGEMVAAGWPPVEIDEQVLNIDKVHNVLGWKPAHTIAQGLEKTIEWYRLRLEAL
ncbi:MAG: NAD-dependent epimerase/dehydratase family protein [Gemmatimonadota bacterium]